MADSSTCGLCGALDSWRHSLLECTSSRSVWALADEEITHKITSNTKPKVKHWLFTVMGLLSHDQFITTAVTLWSIWHARRKAIHEAIFQSPQATHSFIDRYLQDLAIISGKEQNQNKSTPVPQSGQPRPKKPPQGYHKIHVDAGVRARKGGSAVAVCMDEGGNYVGSSALVIEGVCDPPTLEAIACREALSLAEDLGIQLFIVALDCQQVVLDITRRA